MNEDLDDFIGWLDDVSDMDMTMSGIVIGPARHCQAEGCGTKLNHRNDSKYCCQCWKKGKALGLTEKEEAKIAAEIAMMFEPKFTIEIEPEPEPEPVPRSNFRMLSDVQPCGAFFDHKAKTHPKPKVAGYEPTEEVLKKIPRQTTPRLYPPRRMLGGVRDTGYRNKKYQKT